MEKAIVNFTFINDQVETQGIIGPGGCTIPDNMLLEINGKAVTLDSSGQPLGATFQAGDSIALVGTDYEPGGRVKRLLRRVLCLFGKHRSVERFVNGHSIGFRCSRCHKWKV